MRDFSKLEKKIKLKFKNPELLEQAFVHRSYLNEHPNYKLDNNERLEFLGDAVLELIVTEYLYNNFPNTEGELTNWRASLVNSSMLNKIANKFDFNDYLFLSKGEQKDENSKARAFILADAVEALIGAIYIDSGLKAAKKFITANILSELKNILENKLYIDPKSKFQETSQDLLGITPTYKVIHESGPDHDKKFIIGAFLGKELVAKGHGASKHEAQVQAAENALKQKKW